MKKLVGKTRKAKALITKHEDALAEFRRLRIEQRRHMEKCYRAAIDRSEAEFKNYPRHGDPDYKAKMEVWEAGRKKREDHCSTQDDMDHSPRECSRCVKKYSRRLTRLYNTLVRFVWLRDLVEKHAETKRKLRKLKLKFEDLGTFKVDYHYDYKSESSKGSFVNDRYGQRTEEFDYNFHNGRKLGY